MKIKAMISAFLLTVGANAIADTAAENNAVNPPRLEFGIMYSNANGQRYLENTDVLDLAQGDKNYCWVASNVGTGEQVFHEIHRTPAGGSYNVTPDGKAVATQNAEGTEHHIALHLSPNQQGLYSNCWTYGSSDPAGQYETTVFVADRIVFPTRTFTISK